MFVDEVEIKLRSGTGGDGCMSFRREKYVPRGGPDGGDGGDGGRIIFQVDANLATLVDYRHQSHIMAGRGTHGKGKDQTGARGEDAVVRVPPGTIVRDQDGEVVADLIDSDGTLVLLKGGRGGRGNARFATSRMQAPRRADRGEAGTEMTVRLELQLLADVGLVGFPNAGKSTLLSRLSAARPKVADYPFTTMSPNLGIVQWAEYESFVLADLPGLIEGAHTGKGLGTRFLRHIQRTRTLLFTLECEYGDLRAAFETLRQELGGFDPALLDKPYAIAYTKADLLGQEEHEDPLQDLGVPRFVVSAVSGRGLTEMVTYLGTEVKRIRQREAAADDEPLTP